MKEQLKKHKFKKDAETSELRKLVDVLPPPVVVCGPKISAAIKLHVILKKRKGDQNKESQHPGSPGVDLMGLVPNEHGIERIYMGIATYGEDSHGGAGSELHSRTNFIISGEQAYIFSISWLHANARAFFDKAAGMQGVYIVDCM